MPSNADHLLTKDEVARLLRVSRRTVERLESTQELVPLRIGRSVRYRQDDVDALIQRRSA